MLEAAHLPLPPARGESVMSRTKTRPVALSPAERTALARLVRTGSHPAQQVRRARRVLGINEDDTDPGRAGAAATDRGRARRGACGHGGEDLEGLRRARR